MQQAVGIENGVTQASFGQLLIEALEVGAFGQPNAAGSFANQAFVLAHRSAQLALHRSAGIPQQRQVAVGGTAGQQVENALALQLNEVLEHIAPAAAEGLALPLQVLAEVGGSRLLIGTAALQQFNALLQPGFVALLQHRIHQQRQQGGREAHRQPWLRALLQRALQHFDEGEIALGEGLEKPVFLQRTWVAATDVRQMAVKHKCQRAGDHEPLSSAEVYGDFLEERPRGLEWT